MVPFFFVFLLFASSCSGYVRFGDIQANILDRQLHSTTHEIIRSKVIFLPDERPDSSIGELIEFELFDGEIAVGDVTQFFTHGPESSSWTGNLRVLSSDGTSDLSVSDGFFGLSCVERACAAHLYIESKLAEYKICPEGSQLTEEGHGLFVLTQINLSDEKKSGTRYNADFQPGSEAVKKLASIPNAEKMETANFDSDLILDIVVMYTPEAMASIGASAAAMKSLIYLANDQANTILSNSEVSLRLRVVDIEFTASNFTEPSKTLESSFGTLLSWLSTPGDGHLDSAQKYRELYKSDIVLLVNNANAYCGLAYLNTGYLDTLGYANYNVGCMYGSVWMHEIGHLLGCYHDRVSDPSSSAANPTYLGFGSCWENAYKTDCTCYKSVMVYDCNTVPNSCTSCSVKNYLANYKVMNSGNPTGTAVSSCGLHINNNRYRAIKYRKSIQPGGMIFSVSPKYAINSTCQVVNITGWQFSTSGVDITSVTLAGVAVTILSQTANTVIVRTPKVAKATGIAGDVIVTTTTGRVTTATAAFTFRTNIIYDIETFTAKSLDSTLWRSNGSLPWSFSTSSNNVMLYKDAGSYTEYEAAELLSYTSPGCTDDYSYLAFQYWAYSTYTFCYGPFTVATRTSLTVGWTTLWTASGYGSASGDTPWKNISMALPTGTIGIRLRIKTADIGACRWWTPVKIDNLAVKKVSTCPSGCSATSTSSFVCQPTNSTYKEDFSAKRLNATRWISNGTLDWTFYKETNNNIALYKNPSTKSSENYYSALVHNIMGSSQIGCNDTATFLSFKYWAYSSYGFCDIFSLSSRSSFTEPWLPLWSKIAITTTTGSSTPWLNVSLDLPVGTVAIRFYAETQINTNCRLHAPFRLDDVTVTYNTYCKGKLSCSNNPIVVVGPTFGPTSFPTYFPYHVPTESPSSKPTKVPSSFPTTLPTALLSSFPTRIPTSEPSTKVPTYEPSVKPTTTPTYKPTSKPSESPSSFPTKRPTSEPTSRRPTSEPSVKPTTTPISMPTSKPSESPSSFPTKRPTSEPTVKPTTTPSSIPTKRPTSEPTSKTPTYEPSVKPTTTPISMPTSKPSESPSSFPTKRPTSEPTSRRPTSEPSVKPTTTPISMPTSKPSESPSSFPTKRPTSEPTSRRPTSEPSRKPSTSPSSFPTRKPTSEPSVKPTKLPTSFPTRKPSTEPTVKPTRNPTNEPTSRPTPTNKPTKFPTNSPTSRPI